MQQENYTTFQLILVPALISLAVSILRLVGELQEWSPVFFGAKAGGGGALVGIAWLVPIFGIYFGYKLTHSDSEARPGRLALFAVGGLAVMIVLGLLAALVSASIAQLFFFVAGSIIVIVFVPKAWPELGKTLIAYGFAARVPVVIIMALAMTGRWGTHYDALPPEAPEMGFAGNFFWYGIIPQFTIWIAFTTVIGMLFGALGVLLARRRQPVEKPA